MDLTTLVRAVVMFAVTNVDDLLLLALFFGQARRRGVAAGIVVGQYLGFGGILAIAVAGSFGAALLPAPVIPYLGLVPIALGLRAAWQVWRGSEDEDEDEPRSAPGLLAVAGITLANGGDNLGVYIPVFTTTSGVGLVVYVAVFLVLVGVWCALGRFLATRAQVARALARYGHLVLPVVLVGIGLLILLGG